MDRWSGKVSIITGASAGIGAEIARALVRNGVHVVGLARRFDKLEELRKSLEKEGAKGSFHSIKCDVQNEGDIVKAFEWTEKNLGGVNILINNAAILTPEPILDGTTETYRKMMEINVVAVATCTREAVRSMTKQKTQGHVININSVAGHNAEIIKTPVSLYCSSKYAITAMCDSLRNEMSLKKLNVKVTSISPGAVETDMVMQVLPILGLSTIPALKPKDVADAVIYALSSPPTVQIREVILEQMA